MGKKIIELNGVSKSFGDRAVIRDFSYNLLRDDRIGVVGPNGAGKSTLMENVQSVFIQALRKPERKVLVRRGVKAEEYFSYCEEVGCDIWGLLISMDSLCGEPVCLWLPERFKKPGTSAYVQGVEVAIDYTGPVPDGFDVISLPETEYLMFQGEPFREEDYCEAITAVQHVMDRYDPTVIGYEWEEANPRIQLAPRGERGYIELRAVKRKG